MPVGRTFNAAQNQVLISPVSNYYQGKAMRLALENKALANEALQQEVDMADAKFDLETRKVETQEGVLEQRITEYADEVGEAKALEEANIIIGITEGAKSAEDPLAYANERMPEFIATLPEGEARTKLEKMAEDGFQAEELAELYKFSLAVNGQFGGGNPNLQQADYIDAGGAARQGAFDPATGQYSAGGESPIAPQATQGDLGGLTPSGLNQVTIDFRKQVKFSATGAASATELVKISYKDPAGLGKSGAIVSFGNEIAATAKNLMNLAGEPPLPASETQKQASGKEGDWDWSALDKEAKKLGMAPEAAARFKSGIYSIAFSAAVGEQGSRPSDKDIQQYIDIYGGGITDAKVFRATIATAMRRQYNMLKFTAELNPEIQDSAAALAVFERPYNEFLSALEGGSGIKTISNEAEYNKLPSGTVFIGPDGKKRTKP